MVGYVVMLGYTPQAMLPLYVRNTLVEINGSTAGGDQVQEVMALDRRYSHYIGRPLNRFEPDKSIPSTDIASFISPYHLAGVTIEPPTQTFSSNLLSHDVSAQGGAANAKFDNSAITATAPDFATAMAKTHATQTNYRNNNLFVKDNEQRVLPPIGTLTRVAQATQDAINEATQKTQERAAKKAKREQRRRLEAAGTVGLTPSLVRMAFNKPRPHINDYLYADEDALLNF